MVYTVKETTLFGIPRDAWPTVVNLNEHTFWPIAVKEFNYTVYVFDYSRGICLQNRVVFKAAGKYNYGIKKNLFEIYLKSKC